MYNINSLDSIKSFYKNFKDLQKLEYTSQYIRWKHLLRLILKYSVIFKSIIQKLGITENSTVFLEQQVIQDEMILMRIKKFPVNIKR